MIKYKVKLIMGYRKDQEHSIPAEEAHKAYYLFTHPEERGIFNNGIACAGKQIDLIVPDWHGTMGWNPDHKLTADDFNELRKLGVEEKMTYIMAEAKRIGTKGIATELNTPLNKLLQGRTTGSTVNDGARSVGQIMGAKTQS